MASNAAGAAGAADPQVVALIEGISDERVAVAAATARFMAAAAKSDALADDDNSAGAKRAREASREEDARLQAASDRLQNARDSLARYGEAKIAGPATLFADTPDPGDGIDQEEKASSRSVKRKLVAPKHGWLDAQGKVHQKNFDRHLLLRSQMDILWKLRKALRVQCEAAPDATNKAERAPGVRRRNLPDPLEFAEKLKGMTICQALELGINQLNEAGAALYVQHKYNAAVAENFVGDEFFGADRKLDMKARMRASVKEVQKLSADAKKAVGTAGGPTYGASGKRNRRRGNRAGAAGGGDRSLPHGFAKLAANNPGDQLGKKQEIVCFKCREKGHFARDCPNK